MKTFSRWMPPLPSVDESIPTQGRVVLLALLACLVVLLFYSPRARGVLIFVVTIGGFASIRERRRARQLQLARPLEDIGTFARALDRRSPHFDPWVVRAVWDAVQSYCIHTGRTPVRPSDRLDDYVDPEDWFDPLAVDAAKRAGRTSEALETNPAFGRLVTIEDMIRLLSTQPRAQQPNLGLQPTAAREIMNRRG